MKIYLKRCPLAASLVMTSGMTRPDPRSGTPLPNVNTSRPLVFSLLSPRCHLAGAFPGSLPIFGYKWVFFIERFDRRSPFLYGISCPFVFIISWRFDLNRLSNMCGQASQHFAYNTEQGEWKMSIPIIKIFKRDISKTTFTTNIARNHFLFKT